MAKKEARIQITAIYDGEFDATEIFAALIFQKHQGCKGFAKMQGIPYNEDAIQKDQKPSGLCRQ